MPKYLADVLTTIEEQAALGNYAREVEPPNCIVELGVFRGGTLRVLAKNARPGVKVYGVDLFGKDGEPEFYRAGNRWSKWWEETFGGRFSWEENEKAARKNALGATIIVNDTAVAGEVWSGEKVGLLFVDADHSYEGVKADWEAWKKHMVKGGVVVFDDYYREKYPGVTRLVDEEIGLAVERVGKIAIIRV